MTTPNELTPLSDPNNVMFIVVDDDGPGFTSWEVDALMNEFIPADIELPDLESSNTLTEE